MSFIVEQILTINIIISLEKETNNKDVISDITSFDIVLSNDVIIYDDFDDVNIFFNIIYQYSIL